MNDCFLPADILLPEHTPLEKWAVIACDQYTSDQEYWLCVENCVGTAPSTLHMVLPEVYLERSTEEMIRQIHNNMMRYMHSGVMKEYTHSYVYVERKLQNGFVRQGVLGMVDLEHYDFRPDSNAAVRATEKTVLERIPPRVAIRKDASLEFSHAIVFCDDVKQQMIESISEKRSEMQMLYDFELMQGGGRISGWLLNSEMVEAFQKMLRSYTASYPDATCFLVADGNHSLVTAKQCYELLPPNEKRTSPARYAMVELENIHSPAIQFEPIHRLVTQTDGRKLLHDLSQLYTEDGVQVNWVQGGERGQISLRLSEGELPVAVIQKFLDNWLQENPGKIDYIHDDDALIRLASNGDSIGFLLPEVNKSELFTYVAAGNTLPRKTFSLGHAAEKRFYLEGRKIK